MPSKHLRILALCTAIVLPIVASAAPEAQSWATITAQARGQSVYWNAWGGDERTNAFIAWAGNEVQRRYGITLRQVKLKDTAEAVTRVVAEKSAGRHTNDAA
jgi:putative thiamine transport system substrate-binding protein